MKIDNLTFTSTNKQKRPLINSQSTGYIATASIVLATASGFVKGTNIRKSHKFLSLVSVLAGAWHIYVVESYKKMYKKAALKS